MVGSALISTGIFGWTLIFAIKYKNLVPPVSLLIPCLNFSVTIWLVPFLLYLSEKRARNRAYFQWCSHKKGKQLEKLLNKLPLGIVVTKDHKIPFVNNECFNILKANRHYDTLTVDSFSAIKQTNSDNTVKTFMLNPEGLPDTVGKKFIHEASAFSRKEHYTIRYTKIKLGHEVATVIILQDQTSFEELQRLDEKYQRLYLASVVHDIRTPINGILGMLEVMEARISDKDIKTYISVAKNSAYLLLFYTYDITDYSQIEANTLSINKALYNPSEVAEECMKLLAFNFERKGVSLIKDINPAVPLAIMSDRHRYMQILLNLLGNALKFTFKGSVTISISYVPPPADLLVTSVTDTGLGIKSADIGKLFKMFGKASDTKEINPTGVGMGLAICKKLAEHMGGSIRVDSNFGQGSTFTFSVKAGLEDYDRKNTSSAADYSEDVSASLQNESRNFLLLVHDSPMTITRKSVETVCLFLWLSKLKP